MTDYKYHKEGAAPNHGDVFVFGSNLAGRHGAGAAKAAVMYYGALYGRGQGYMSEGQNHCYAIPTKDANIRTLPLYAIKEHIRRFIKFAKSKPDMSFFVTRVGCGLAEYRDSEIAPLFEGVPTNCNMPQEWERYLYQTKAQP